MIGSHHQVLLGAVA